MVWSVLILHSTYTQILMLLTVDQRMNPPMRVPIGWWMAFCENSRINRTFRLLCSIPPENVWWILYSDLIILFWIDHYKNKNNINHNKMKRWWRSKKDNNKRTPTTTRNNWTALAQLCLPQCEWVAVCAIFQLIYISLPTGLSLLLPPSCMWLISCGGREKDTIQQQHREDEEEEDNEITF